MIGWDAFKKYFNSWEAQTAKVSEQWLKSPLVLEPAGALLSTVMRTKAAGDRTRVRRLSGVNRLAGSKVMSHIIGLVADAAPLGV